MRTILSLKDTAKLTRKTEQQTKQNWKRAKGNHVQVKPAKQIPSGI
jgi:hypothetical protein